MLRPTNTWSEANEIQLLSKDMITATLRRSHCEPKARLSKRDRRSAVSYSPRTSQPRISVKRRVEESRQAASDQDRRTAFCSAAMPVNLELPDCANGDQSETDKKPKADPGLAYAVRGSWDSELTLNERPDPLQYEHVEEVLKHGLKPLPAIDRHFANRPIRCCACGDRDLFAFSALGDRGRYPASLYSRIIIAR